MATNKYYIVVSLVAVLFISLIGSMLSSINKSNQINLIKQEMIKQEQDISSLKNDPKTVLLNELHSTKLDTRYYTSVEERLLEEAKSYKELKEQSIWKERCISNNLDYILA